MAQSVREVMTPDPIALPATSTVAEAAQAMRDQDVGPVLVLDQNQNVCGIVTDRDITIRVVAEGLDPSSTPLDDICSDNPTTLTPDDSVEDAVSLMREQAIRRLPIVEGGKPVGIVSIGDLAIERDPDSALADISATEPDK